MENLNNFESFMNEPNKFDYKSFQEQNQKYLKLFKDVEDKVFKRLERQNKSEDEIFKKEKDLNEKKSKRQKEIDDLEEKNYKDKLDSAKKEKENLEKLKTSAIDQLIPKNIKNITQENQQTQPNEGIFQKILKVIPDQISKIVGSFKQNKDEQENIGENVLRVSFHPEGVKILKTLLDPIYKALNANTDALKNLFKTEENKSNAWGILLLAALGGILKLIDKISDAIKWASNVLEGWKTKFLSVMDDLAKLPKKFKELIKYDELVDTLKLKWTKFIDTAKDIIKYDELAEAFQAQKLKYLKRVDEIFDFGKMLKSLSEFKLKFNNGWTKYVNEPLLNAGNFISDVFKSISDTIKTLNASFKEGEVLKSLITVLESVWNGIKTLTKPLELLYNTLLKPIVTVLENLIKPLMPLLKTLGWVLMLLDPLIAAGKTLFDVWNNENLSGIEKGVAVLVSAIGGLGDGIASLIGIVSEGAVGLWNFITGKGWKTENAVGNFMRGVTDDYSMGGMGNKMGKATANLFEHGSLTNPNDVNDKSKPAASLLTPMAKKAEEFMADGDFTEEEMEYLDKKFDQMGQPVEDFVKQANNKPKFILEQGNPKIYKTNHGDDVMAAKKGGILDESLTKIQKIMSEVNDNIKLMNENSSKVQPNYVNNNTNIVNGGSKESKEYLFKPLFDVNSDKRSQWWRMSREYSATY